MSSDFRISRSGLAALVAMSVLGLAVIAGAVLDRFVFEDDISGRITGFGSINDRIGESGVEDMVIPIVSGDGEIDILFVGAPDCVHCRDFVAGGFSDMRDLAGDMDLDMAYMPFALGAVGVSLGTVEACARGGGATPGEIVIRELYRSVPGVEAVLAESRAGGADPVAADIPAPVKEVFSDVHEDIGGSGRFSPACFSENADRILDGMKRFSGKFAIKGTPAFFIRANGDVYHFTGAPDIGTVSDLVSG